MSKATQPDTRLLSTPEEAQRRVARAFIEESGESIAGYDTRRLLQARLRLAAAALLALAVAFLVRDFFFGFETGERTLGIGQLILLGMALVVLFRGTRLGLKSLRLIELVVFGVHPFRMV